MNTKIMYAVIGLLAVAVIVLGAMLILDNNDSNGDDASDNTDIEQQTEQEETEEADFQVYSADDVVTAFEEAGLAINNVEDQEIGGTAAPATEVESKSFTIPAVAPQGGQILIFADEEGLESKQAWFDNYPELAPYVYVNGNAMVQLNSGVPGAEAAEYREALENM